jgi:hypothetical protein
MCAFGHTGDNFSCNHVRTNFVEGRLHDTLCRYCDAITEGDVEALLEKNRDDLEIENAVVDYTVDLPDSIRASGQRTAAKRPDT